LFRFVSDKDITLRTLRAADPSHAVRLALAVTLDGRQKGRIAAEAGLHPSLLSHYLQGRPIGPEHQAALARVLRIPKGVLFPSQATAA
jgi:hypothetical protein